MSWLFFLVAGLVVAADQVSKKALASHFLPDESRTVIPHALWLTYVQNRHGAFGLFGSQSATSVTASGALHKAAENSELMSAPARLRHSDGL